MKKKKKWSKTLWFHFYESGIDSHCNGHDSRESAMVADPYGDIRKIRMEED